MKRFIMMLFVVLAVLSFTLPAISEDKINLTNGQLELITSDSTVLKIINSINTPKERLEIYKLVIKITQSPELMDYKQARENMRKQFQDKDASQDVKNNLQTEYVALTDKESNIKIDKIKLKNSSLKDITAKDMIVTSWLFIFEE